MTTTKCVHVQAFGLHGRFFFQYFFNTVDDFLYVLASKDPVCALLAKFLSMK